MIAAMNGNLPVVKLLTKEGASLQLEAIDGKTARDFAQDALLEV